MKSIVIREFGGSDRIEVAETLVPEPGPGQVRIRVAAAPVNPIDLSVRAGRLADAGLMVPRFPVGFGWDVAGYVAALGPAPAARAMGRNGRLASHVAGPGLPLAVGDPVVGLRDLLFAPGTHAEFVVLDATAVAPAPPAVALPDAATLPLNGLTADTCLALAALPRGGTLLVTGAAGGVGGFVTELARLRGHHVIGLARPTDEAALSARGAALVTDPDRLGPDVRDLVPGGVDAVIDAAVIGVGAHEALRDGGTFVALVRPFAPPPIRGTRVAVAEVQADGARLTELSALMGQGILTTSVAATLPLTAAAEAHAMLENGGQRGRIVLLP